MEIFRRLKLWTHQCCCFFNLSLSKPLMPFLPSGPGIESKFLKVKYWSHFDLCKIEETSGWLFIICSYFQLWLQAKNGLSRSMSAKLSEKNLLPIYLAVAKLDIITSLFYLPKGYSRYPLFAFWQSEAWKCISLIGWKFR